MTITEQPETATGPAINFGDVQAAAERLRGVAHRTPVLTSRTLDAMTGARVYLKAEPFQRIGAFKFRGAYNAISALEPETRSPRRGHELLREPRPGRGALGADLRDPGDDRHADRRSPGQDRRHTRLRRGDRLLRSV